MRVRLLAATSLLIPTLAKAQAAAQQGPSTVEMLIMPLGFLLIMYFFMIRPQQKRAREHQAFISALKAGDEVVTSGGIIGRVKSVAEGFVNVEVAGDTVIKVLKSAIEGQSPKAQAATTKP
ncbi:MAG: preprotein translocase subunit YajC [bacterium]|jgi:preprotein translocase subunit YajC